MKSLLLLVSLASTAFAFTLPTVERVLAPLIRNEDAETIPDEYIVMFKNDALSHDSIENIIHAVTAEAHITEHAIIHHYEDGFAAVMTEESLEIVRARAEVDFVEPNQVVYAVGLQTNPPSWGLARISQREFRVRNLYRYPDTAGENVDVYVIDTGISIEHEDFAGRAFWGFTAPAGDNDKDGNGHGTHVASTVAGLAYGVAKKAHVIAVKVLRSSGFGTTADVVAGIEWAAKKSTQTGKRSAANMSLGGGRSAALDNAVEGAIKKGLQFAVAAGNSNQDACRFSPAGVEPAVTVGASSSSDARSYFSNYGPCVDIFGPGQDITGAWIGSNTAKRTISGTSMASPHVAGVMALFLSEKDYTPADLKAKVIEVSTSGALSNLPANTVNKLLHNDVGSESSNLYF